MVSLEASRLFLAAFETLLNLDCTGWYYYGPRTPGGGVPKRASLLAFVRASTLSLGSIAFGSLLVTILELLRLILQLFRQYEAGQGDSMFSFPALTFILCDSR